MSKGQRDEEVEHVFTREDREAQLQDLEIHCSDLADILAEYGEVRAAELYRVRAKNASMLLADGFSQADLNEVGGKFPEEPFWLDPRALDYGPPREPWQSEVAQIHGHAQLIALDIRAIATRYRR